MASADPRFTYILTALFEDEGPLQEALLTEGINTYRALRKFATDSDKVNALKWRSADTNIEEDVPDEKKELFPELINYINWAQNQTGPVKTHPIRFDVDLTIDGFHDFLCLLPVERGGESDGTVNYSLKEAKEARNYTTALVQLAPQPTPPGGIGTSTSTTAATTPSTSSKYSVADHSALDKIIVSTSTLPVLKYGTMWMSWWDEADCFWVMRRLGELLDRTYVVPTDKSSGDYGYYYRVNMLG